MDFENNNVRWNPHIGEDTREELSEVELSPAPDFLVNNNHSSDALRWDGDQYFGKQKERRPANTIQELTRTGEFDHVLSLYNEHHDTSVHAPTPYCAVLTDDSELDEVVMELLNGDKWFSFPQAFSQGDLTEEYEVKSVCESVGEFAKILSNERMAHGDIAWRHFFLDSETYDVGVIDIEGGTVDARECRVEEEYQEMLGVLDQIPRPQYEEDIPEWFQEGYESVPTRENTDLPQSEYECSGDYSAASKVMEILGI